MRTAEDIFIKSYQNDTGFSLHYLTLYAVVLGLETKMAFEFGAGYSTKVILAALEKTGGKLTSCDTRPVENTVDHPEDFDAYRPFWTYLRKDSREAVAAVRNVAFDFVLHDGSHQKDVVHSDLNAIIPLMKKDAMLLVHDTEHPDKNYGLREVCEEVLKKYEHEKVTLPYGYGLTVIRILEDFGNGKVTLTWRKGQKG